MHTTFRLGLATFAALALAAVPAAAQEGEQQESGVSCDPANPPAGSQTDCTAQGLMPNSEGQWTAEFTDGSSQEGVACADISGAAMFTVAIPGTTPVGGYQVTVTGQTPEGEEYEEVHRGLITPGGGSSEQPSEQPSEPAGSCPTSTDTGGGAGGGGTTGGDGGDSFGAPAPQGGIDTGLGGTADRGTSPWLPAGIVAALAALGAVVRRSWRRGWRPTR